jgi:ATP-binding cassette subfamily C protein LapB
LLLASLTINLLALVVPVVVLLVYDRVIPNGSGETLAALLVLIGAALALDVAIRAARTSLTSWVGARFEHAAHLAVMARLVGASPEATTRAKAGGHVERFEAIAHLREFYAGQGLLLLVDFPFALLFLALVACISPTLGAVVAALLGLFTLAALAIGRALRAAVADRRTVDDRRYSFLIETLGAIHTAKAIGMEAALLRRYERLMDTAGAASYRVNALHALAQALGAHVTLLAMAVVAGVGGFLALGGDLTVGSLAACSLLAGRGLQPLLRAMGLWAQMQGYRVARQRIAESLAIPAAAPEGLPPIPEVSGAIELRGVTFRHEGSADDVLRDVDLAVEPGEAIAILGQTGSGRSTLLSLIHALNRPRSGLVLLDGRDATLHDPRSIRERIAYLPPVGAILRGSLLDNLTLFRPHLHDEAMALAAKIGLHQIVARLPRGYATMVGQTSFEAMPGGVRQRIAIVRGLVNRPSVVLFDEADGQLDAEGDRLFKQLLEELKGRTTMVLVSHRPSVLALADRAYRLEGGRLAPAPITTVARSAA